MVSLTPSHPESESLYKGKYIELLRNDRWEYVRRVNASGVVVIVPVTKNSEVIFVEQYRKALDARVIEWPAGLVGDKDEFKNEKREVAAERELLEETGFQAETIKFLVDGPVSSGMSSETISFYLAEKCVKKSVGGGDDTEDIQTYVIPLRNVDEWLQSKIKEGFMMDPKIYVGLYFLK